MSEELKSCPFCGCRSHIVWEGRKIGWAVQCRNCLVLGPQQPSEQESITAWNARAGDAMADSHRLDWLETESCDVRFLSGQIADTGDVYVHCEIIQHHMENPHERAIGSAETIRAAIDEAREVG